MSSENQSEPEIIINDERQTLDHQIIAAFNEDNIELVKDITKKLHIADLADLIDILPTEQGEKLIEVFKNSIDPQLFVEIENEKIKQKIITLIGAKETAKVISLLEIDDLVFALDNLNNDLKEEIISNLSIEQKKELEEIFSYPEDSAGRIMQKKFIAVPEYWTVGKAIDYMRSSQDVPIHFYEIFVVDPKYKPIGSVTLGSMMHHKRDMSIKDIMKKDIKIVSTHVDQDEISYLFKQYGLLSVPVINKIGRLVGAITIDDALLLIEQESEEDIMHLGGVNETDFHQEIFRVVKSRFPWLFINLLTATLTAFVINFFQATIEQIVVLAAIMPIVASLGGNAGTQTMTISVVALASKELTTINFLRVILKQVLACSMSGFMIAIIGGSVILIWHHDVYLAYVFAASVTMNFAFAGFFGSSIPILIHKMGLDPAIASPIFLTTLTDVLGFLCFLGLATLFLL